MVCVWRESNSSKLRMASAGNSRMMRALVGKVQAREGDRMVMTATMRNWLQAVSAFVALLLLPAAAGASQPRPWEMNLQPAASPIAEMIHRFNNGLLIVVT